MFLKTFLPYISILACFATAGCSGGQLGSLLPGRVDTAVDDSNAIREKTAEYERRFYAQVDSAYRMFSQGKGIPASEIVGGDELHLELAVTNGEFWQKLQNGFTEIGRNTRSDFVDQFVTLPHQGGVRVGFVDLVRAKVLWDAMRADAHTEVALELDIPLVPDRVVQEDPAQCQKPTLEPLPGGGFLRRPFTVIPKGHVVDVQGAKFADDSLRFVRLDIRFPELKQAGKVGERTRRAGMFKQIKTTTWRESPKIRHDMLSLPQLVLPKGVALVALVPAERMEIAQSNDIFGRTYAPERSKVPTSLIVLMLPKRVSDAFAEQAR